MIAIGCNATEEQFIIWVRDNGIGLDMEYHDRIFQIFHRLQQSEGYTGTGVVSRWRERMCNDGRTHLGRKQAR
jgi:light-regulated signal transduction histidine kinase (bacteriophytochrome)